MKKEVFRLCTYPGVKEGAYLISNYGRLKTVATGKIRTIKSISSNGYLHTSLGRGKDVTVHRLVAWEFRDGYDESNGVTWVNHKDSNRLNNYYKNLEWCTPSQNNLHAFRVGGRIPVVPDSSGPRPKIKGSSNPNSRFTDDEVHGICKLLSEGYTLQDVMKHHNSTYSNNLPLYSLIKNLIKRRNWHHITEQYEY